MYTHFSSDGMSLHFPHWMEDKLYREELEELQIRHYAKIRNQYGIYVDHTRHGSNFVSHVDELTIADSKYMEQLLNKHSTMLMNHGIVLKERGRVK